MRQKKAGFYVELSAGIGTLNRSAKANAADPLERVMLLDHRAFELTRFNTLTDLRIGYQMKTGLFLQSGLNYSEKQELLNWKDAILINTTEFINQRAYFSLDELGDTTFYSGRSEQIETTTRELRHWNKLKSYELPLAFGYSKRYNKLNFRASIGIVLNLSRQFEGRIIGLDKDIVDNPEIGIRKSVGYTTAFGIGYQIIDEHQLFVKGSYRRSPTFHVSSVDQFYQSLNVQLGVRAFLRN